MSWPTMTDYQEAIQNPRICFVDPELQRGAPMLDQLGLPKPITGGFASVYQMNCNGRRYAVRCFLRYHQDQQHRYDIISSYLQQARLPYMVSFEFLRQGIKVQGRWYPILKMEWVDGDSLNSYIERNLNNPEAIQNLAQGFLDLVSDLRRCSIAHGDLQHGNILIVNGNFRLIDYDGMYVPGLEDMQSHELGHRNYQHPRRTEQDYGPHLDNFSAWIIYLSLVALSVDQNLWHRLGAGDERLLFSREDFENPRLSPALRALEGIRDSNVQSLASLFLSLSYCSDLSKIPPLDGTQMPAGIPIKDGTAVGVKSVPVPPVEVPAWIWDHMPVSIKQINVSCLPERISLMVLAIIGGFLIYTVTGGVLAPQFASFTMGAGFISVLLLFTFRFRSLPVVQEKLDISSNLQNMHREVRQIENTIARLNNDRNKLDQDEQKRASELSLKQRECAQREENEIDGIDRELQRTLATLNSQMQSLNQTESNEIVQALHTIQSQFLDNQLAHYDLSTARIQGLGPEMKKRLLANGIRTAADIVNIHIVQAGWGRYPHEIAYIEISGRGRVHIEGIGSKKASALLSWRRNIESQCRRSVPQSLPPAQEAKIRSKYESQRQSLINQESNLKQTANQKRDAVRARYFQEQNALARQLQEVRGQFAEARISIDQKISDQRKHLSEKHWTLAKMQREIATYQQVRFTAYLKHVLCL